jgi:adenine-specific DNA-methyltransferase
MHSDMLQYVEAKRAQITANLHHDSKGPNGQYLTPAPIAEFMASMFSPEDSEEVRLLDAGAGSLLAAFLDRWCNQRKSHTRISVTAYEIDPYLLSKLRDTVSFCERKCYQNGMPVSFRVIEEDFVLSGSRLLARDLFSPPMPAHRFTHAILNPPYRKIHSKSQHRLALRRAGIETSNLYTAFLAIAIRLLEPGGELVAITPRSFCNGPYFLPFRELLLREASLRRIHVFHSRESAFRDDDVLQENIIFHAIKNGDWSEVIISSSSGRDFEDLSIRKASFHRVVSPGDRKLTIHVPTNDIDDYVLDRMALFSYVLEDLGLQVSTGPVVDFRLREYIHDEPGQGAVPLIYPAHFEGNKISWPLPDYRKPNAIDNHPSSRKWLMPNGYYVLTRRFSSKEEKRRIVAALHDPTEVESDLVGFENHLNVFHCNRRGLNERIAKGLTAYLNSTLVDLYFRQFSGHTQVNASDLRMLPYPSEQVLVKLGMLMEASGHCSQEDIDEFLESSVSALVSTPNPVKVVTKIEEARQVLGSLRIPQAFRDELSAQYLLALLNLKPESEWFEAAASPLTHGEILDFIYRFYGRRYVLPQHARNGTSRLEVFEKHGLARVMSKHRGVAGHEGESVQLMPKVVQLVKAYGLGTCGERH